MSPTYSDETLLELFNKRDTYAFGVVYRRFYRELFLYADHLFRTLEVEPEDAIQDIFADIWVRSSVRFESLEYIKTFCFIALKNAYKNAIKHLGYQKQYELEARVEREFSEDVERAELYGRLYDAVQLLPADYATVIRMYLEGWKPEEIATRLNLALQTVYNKRREAVVLLRKYMNRKD